MNEKPVPVHSQYSCMRARACQHYRCDSGKQIPAAALAAELSQIFMCGERSGSVIECLTRDQEAVGSSLTDVTAL